MDENSALQALVTPGKASLRSRMRITLEEPKLEEAKEAVKGSRSSSVLLPDLGSRDKERASGHAASLRVLRMEAEVTAISRALTRCGWNRRRAAQLLCISYRGLLYKIRQYNIRAAMPSDVVLASELEKAE
jgi:DNA-binding NtrC family response regulator